MAAEALVDRLRASYATETDYRMPAPAGCVPYPFQEAGVEYARTLEAAIVADEPGLGKTIQGAGWLNAIGARRPLIVCPASLRINWRRELEKWTTWDPDTTVVSYNEVQRGRLGHVKHDAVVFDEAHYLKNADSKRSEISLKLPIPRRLFLTGTPVVNRPIELWTLLRSIDSSTWGNRTDYGMTYCGGRWNGYEWDFNGASNLLELQKRIRSTCMVRRRKVDVLKDLPAKVRQLIELPAESAVKTDELLAAVRQLWKAKQSALTPAAVAALGPHREVVKAQLAKVRHEEALSKVPAVIAHCMDLLVGGVEKLVVFAHHRDVIELLRQGLGGFGPVVVQGGMTDEQKQAAVDAFQTKPAVRVFIGQLATAGVGLTLTAASTVVFAELDWVPGVMTQCEDRCHRIGQKNSVLVHHLVLDGSLDARIAKSLIRKQAVLDQTLDAEAMSADFDWVTALATGETEAS